MPSEKNSCLANLFTELQTQKNVFNIFASFIESMDIPLNKIRSVCTYGTPFMLRNRSGFVNLFRQEVPDVLSTRCMLHRQALMSKTLPPNFKDVMNSCVKIINFIRGRALNHRLFKAFCNELDESSSALFFHTEVRWLPCAKVVERFFLAEKNSGNFCLTRNQTSIVFFKFRILQQYQLICEKMKFAVGEFQPCR